MVLTASCQNKQKTIVATLEQCQKFLDKNDYNGASSCYQKAIIAQPDSAIELSKAGHRELFKKCVELKDEKFYQSAIHCLNDLEKLQSNSANIYFLLADSNYQYYKQLFNRSKMTDLELLNRAEEAVISGLELKPDDAAAHALYGDILKEKDTLLEGKGYIQVAIEEYKKSVELKPETRVFWVYLGMAQEKNNDITGAIGSYEKALSIKADDTLMLYFLGKLYDKEGKRDKALEKFEKLFEIDPNYDDVKQRIEALTKKRKAATN